MVTTGSGNARSWLSGIAAVAGWKSTKTGAYRTLFEATGNDGDPLALMEVRWTRNGRVADAIYSHRDYRNSVNNNDQYIFHFDRNKREAIQRILLRVPVDIAKDCGLSAVWGVPVTWPAWKERYRQEEPS